MQRPLLHTIHKHSFWVSPDRSLYWEEENCLVVSDLHLGKTGHFRKSGIAVPQSMYKADLQRLMAQLYFYKCDRLVIVGDLTHSDLNSELDLFLKWRNDFSSLQIDLVKGNHDILDKDWYKDANIHVHELQLAIHDFLFIHDLKALKKTDHASYQYTFTGHVHPGVLVKGGAKQSLRFPCFYFAKDHCVLPAFSRFTGTYTVEPLKDETVYAIVENKLMQL